MRTSHLDATHPFTNRRAVTVLVVLLFVVASLTFVTGRAFAAPMPPEHVFILPIGDPCPQCPYPTPTKQAKPIESHAPLAKFTSRGHAFGFQSNGVVVSNATYALNIEFVGANQVASLARAATSNQAALKVRQVVSEPNNE